ncbi:recombinase family protein [Clostridium sporogenes]|uniref:recombinase family protein n=1 Tax=Clostridium sporogenes TaxID=1509 RepID=UPI0022380413|nr:recombinase family protein [Clostridium sporogenes]MCW6078083.1 recombinase family protein [Clostridium sporogenes]
MKKLFGYCRISSTSQNLSRQLDQIKEQGIEDRDIFCDKQSGKDFNREQYQLLKKMVRSGDCIVVTELDRFGRNMNEIKEELHWFTKNDVEVKILDLPLLNGTGLEAKFINGILLELFTYLSEKEREKIRSRQAQGIKIAREEGKYKGRKKKEIEGFQEVVQQWREKKISVLEACRKLGISSPTFYRRVNEVNCNK